MNDTSQPPATHLHIRPSRDGLKVGGHQASSASLVTIPTALHLDVLQPQDRVAVKPHAAPVFHALRYLPGRQSIAKLVGLRGYGGAQSYPSLTKDDVEDIDVSTGFIDAVARACIAGACTARK